MTECRYKSLILVRIYANCCMCSFDGEIAYLSVIYAHWIHIMYAPAPAHAIHIFMFIFISSFHYLLIFVSFIFAFRRFCVTCTNGICLFIWLRVGELKCVRSEHEREHVRMCVYFNVFHIPCTPARCSPLISQTLQISLANSIYYI